MAVADYKKYLAEAVLNDRRTVTYRLLSRALRVHSTLAKQMLYDFHRTETAKKPGSVHATYIVTGVPTAPAAPAAPNGAHAEATNGHDAMPSSPYLSSSMPNPEEVVGDAVPTWSVVLVREEDLEDAKASFKSVDSVYVYSLQPATLQDLNVLADVRHEMEATYGKEDPLELGGQWGMIQSKTVKRRTGMRPPVPAPAPKAVPAKRPAPDEKSQKKAEPESKKEESESEKPSKPSTRESTPASSKPTEKTAPNREKGSLFSSFAKAKPKQKKETPATPASALDSAQPSGAEDVVLDDASEEEPEELFPDTGKSTASNRETRKEREEKLRQMMEDSEDEEMPDTTEPPEEESTPIDEPPPKTELKEEATVQGGRRRGKRQVMKKKTIKDEEGYLVTVEEPAWESFSEDEAPPPKKKPAVSAPKGKAGAKAGQGNIMSFFGKK